MKHPLFIPRHADPALQTVEQLGIDPGNPFMKQVLPWGPVLRPMAREKRSMGWSGGVFVSWAVLWFCLRPDPLRQATGVNLQRFVGCAVREFTFLARKPGCRGLHVTTDACWGRCETWEKPILDPPFIESYQRVCTYNETRLATVRLPDCSANVDPTYTYPVALRCDCGVCVTSTTECITSV